LFVLSGSTAFEFPIAAYSGPGIVNG